MIAPADAIQNLEPAWAGCGGTQFAFDPPRTLAPASVLVPSPTPTDQAGPQEIPAMPSRTSNQLPLQTQLGGQPPIDDPLFGPTDPTGLVDGGNPPSGRPQPPNGDQNIPPNVSTSDTPTDLQGAANPTNFPDSDPYPPNGNAEGFPKIGPSAKPKAYLGNPKSSWNPSQDDTIIFEPPIATSLIIVGDQTFTPLPKGGYSIADTSIRPNDPAITIQDTSILLGNLILVVGSLTLSLATGSASGTLTANGVEFTPLGPGSILIDGNTLSINGPAATVSGNAISLASYGIVVAGQTFAYPTTAPKAQRPQILTVAGQTITQLGSSSAIIDGITLLVNGPAQIVSSTTLSLASGGIIIDGQTHALPTPAPDGLPSPNGIYTIAGQKVARLGSSSAIIDGLTFSINGPAKTVAGTFISLASSALVVAGQTYPFPNRPLYTASNVVIIDGTSLTAGGPTIKVSGTALSLASGSAGLYLTGTGTASSSAFSAPVTAGESMTMNAAGELIENSGGRSQNGGLGSLVMLGFGQAGATSTSSMAGAIADATIAGNAISTADLVEFLGNGNRNLGSRILGGLGLTVFAAILAAW
ncbi:hypothetical protein OEA41_001663 [Lepraria neglecta]|uniref:Uncharacterized protein n=1 Tax=Lepraria neglecta TaxID=209136 RepID=A0AAD9ZDK9_9LECA|nr:hypothetical protein OEA41_001663 [Lepraria neglecta]